MLSLVPARDLVLTQPDDPERPWVVTVGESTPVRITRDLAMVLKWYKDGQRGEVDDYLGTRITSEQLEEAVNMLQRFDLLVQTENTKVCSTRSRFRFISLFSIQFAILNKQQHFSWLEKIANKSVLFSLAIASALFSLIGVAVILAKSGVFFEALTTPQPVLAVFYCLLLWW